ncbi:MAG: hypothetical protein ABIF09_09440 [Gemmatimonadota bacterium]
MGVSVELEFDRPDRTYRTGEAIRGHLHVNTRGGGRVSEIRPTHSWETRGLGNIDHGIPTPIPLVAGALPTDSTFTLPFEFTAPKGPLSYRGQALEVVHYLELEAEVAGGRDLLLIEEYIVVPGPLLGPPPTHLSRRHLSFGETLVHGKGPPSRSQIGRSILSPFLKRKVAELRLGSVKAHLSSQVGVPGDNLDVEIRITPKKPTPVNGASIELRALELCSSGTVSQTNRITKRYPVYSKVTPIPIPSPRTLGPESLSRFRVSALIPDKGLYSFVLEENALAWEAVVRVDVPLWPDWERVFPLLVWPAEGQGEERRVAEEPQIRQEAEIVEELEVAEELEVSVEPEAPDEPADRPSATTPESTDSTPTLAESVRAIRAEEIFGGNRNRLIKSLLGKLVSFDLTVARVERTFAMFSDAAYRNGRTLTGTVPESGMEVRVWFPEAQNDLMDPLETGSIYPITGTVAELDRLNSRPTIRAEVPPAEATEQG